MSNDPIEVALAVSSILEQLGIPYLVGGGGAPRQARPVAAGAGRGQVRTTISASIMTRPARLVILLCCAAPLAAQGPSPLELGVLEETNLARANPKAYADHLEAMLSWFRGDVLFKPGSTVGLRTNEGASAVREAIAFLWRQPPLPALEWSPGLWRAARDHARDQGPTGATGHAGADGATMEQRMSRYGQWLGTAAENIDYGSTEPRDVVISLIVDDGVAGRGHRANIFNPSLRVAGVGCGSHRRYRHICVIDYAGGYEPASR